MPITKEFIVLIEDRPGALEKVCRGLAERDVNILALQSSPVGAKSVTRFICDDPGTAKAVLTADQLTYAEEEIVQIKIQHRPGEIARLASLLAQADININYVYCGLEPRTNAPLVFFGVAEAAKATRILEHAVSFAAEP